MGNYYSFGLDIKADEGHENDVEKFEKALLDDFDNDFEIKELIDDGGVYGKCYGLEETITKLAPKFPHLLIILSGDGDEVPEWETRWKGCDTETQECIIPPFENKNLWTKNEKKNNN